MKKFSLRGYMQSLQNDSLSNSYHAIMCDEVMNQSEKRTNWIEFVNFICSVPERSANLMALNQSQQEEISHLSVVNFFEKLAVDIETLIFSKSEFGELNEDEMEILVFASEELISKICRIGHSIYQNIWHRVIARFLPHTLESFLSSLLLFIQKYEFSEIVNPASIENKIRYQIRNVAEVIGLLIGKINSGTASYLIKYKYFVGGKQFSIIILRVLCCFLSLGYLQRQPNDVDGNLRLGLDDDLISLLKTLIPSWSDPTFIKHGSIASQIYVTSAILIIFGYLPKEILIKAAIPREITLGVTRWLESSSDRTRKLGMITAEMLSRLTDEPGNILDFEMNTEDEEIRCLKQLIEVKDGMFDINDEFSKEYKMVKETKSVDKDQKEISKINFNNLVISVNEQNTLEADSDDEDDFEPYPMEGKKITVPVYIIDLIRYLGSNEEPEKIEVGIKNAGKLIRNKTNFGMELDDNANELARVLINLQDNFNIKEFEESRQEALTALLCGSPKIGVPYIIQQLFENRYSLSDKLMLLSVISASVKELAGTQINENVSSNQEFHLIDDDDLIQKTSDMSLTTLKIPKENRFSRRPQLEAARKNSTKINKFNEFAAKTFFFPLTSGFWMLTRDREQNNMVYEPILLQRYIMTLTICVQCSTNIIDILQITREFWDLILSLRYNDDQAVLSALLYGLITIMNSVPERDLAETFGKELIETQKWVNVIFENNMNEKSKSLAVWIMVKIDEIINSYRQLLIGDLLPLT
ncbi:6967_t:CDS:10 [Diversispora eburnea]|uniref:6967_t:CDS:1 n=1 Tax=Diversispora eburnea TaxID=1213867 RepID=A0A9N8V7P1_9GLOM|nr:6967_t:CDS:10 [Diversispora eburnea]